MEKTKLEILIPYYKDIKIYRTIYNWILLSRQINVASIFHFKFFLEIESPYKCKIFYNIKFFFSEINIL